jgi:hypothetical protein
MVKLKIFLAVNDKAVWQGSKEDTGTGTRKTEMCGRCGCVIDREETNQLNIRFSSMFKHSVRNRSWRRK